MNKAFQCFARRASVFAGSPWAFVAALAMIALWAVSRPLFRSSDTWQLVINTATTLVTFVMVFLIQNDAKHESKATQAKLDELLRSHEPARDELQRAEERTEEELEELRRTPGWRD